MLRPRGWAPRPPQSSARRCRDRRASARCRRSRRPRAARRRPRRRPPARPRKSRSALRDARKTQHRVRHAGVGVGQLERVADGVDRGRDRVGVAARVEHEVRRAAAALGAAPEPRRWRNGLQRRRTAPSSASAWPSRGEVARSSPAGSATRSIRSTMSADSKRPPASRNAYASSRSIVREATPQNSAVRLLDVA